MLYGDQLFQLDEMVDIGGQQILYSVGPQEMVQFKTQFFLEIRL